MFFKETFTPGLSNFDINGRLSYRSIFEAMENAGSHHSDASRDSLIAKEHDGIAWILSEWRVKIAFRPTVPEKLEVTTWTGGRVPASSVFRDFTLKSSGGETVASASTRVVLLDLKTERLARISEELIGLYGPEQARVFEDAVPKLKPLPEYENERAFSLRHADLDFNRHVHNTAYVDFITEVIPESFEAREIRILYSKPVKYGGEVSLKHTFTEDGCHICVFQDGVPCTVIEVR